MTKTTLAENKARQLFIDLEKGFPYNSFPTNHFTLKETVYNINFLKQNCDFSKKTGGLISSIYKKSKNGTENAVIVYQYDLNCGTLKFVLTYDLSDTVALMGFKVDKVK